MTSRRHIAFLDILGFQNIVATTSPDQILAIYKDIEQIISDDIQKRRELSRALNEQAGGNSYVAPVTDLECRFFSDTILIFSRHDVEPGLYEADYLCALLIHIYNHLLLRHSWLLRGAFAIGELYVDGPALFGRDLIRAYLAEQEQEWAAIIALDKTDMMFNPHNIYTCDYSVPMKTGRKDGAVLNFFVDHEFPVSFLEVFKRLVALRQRQYNPGVQRKLDNTLELFEHLIKRGISAKTRIENMSYNDFDKSTAMFPHLRMTNELVKRFKARPLILP